MKIPTMKTHLILLLTLTMSPALFAQAPAAANLLPAEFPKNRQTEITVPIPAGTKNLQCSVTVNAPDFRKMPLQGYGVGVWFRFHNEAGEALKNNGQVPGKSHGPLGFALGVERKTTTPKTDEKKVAVPPGATKIEVRVTQFCTNGTATVTGPDGFTVDAVSVTPVP